jgi:peptidoglycan/LPS O-acetylase OafA/YrhL
MLSSLSRFAHRRAWRILPPYWAALAFSVVVAWTVTPQPGSVAPTGRTVAVYGLLLQDILGAPSPNGAFWSIAVEAQLYVVFPLMLVLLRRAGMAVMLAVVTVVVASLGVLAPHVRVVALAMRLTPQFAVLFALGLAAAGILTASDRVRRLPWHWLAAIAVTPVLLTMGLRGSVWWASHMFWVDLAIGPAAALMLVAVCVRRPAPVVRLLDTRPLRGLGLFSYSLYLTHAPIVVAINRKVVAPHVAAGLPTFWATLAIAVPVCVLAAWSFSKVFEIPFQRHRSWGALRSAVAARMARTRRPSVGEQTAVGDGVVVVEGVAVSDP